MFVSNLRQLWKRRQDMEEAEKWKKKVEHKYIWYVNICACTHKFNIYYFETPKI